MLVIAGLAVWLSREYTRIGEPQPSPAEPFGKAKAVGLSQEERATIQGGHPLAAELNAQDHSPQRDLQILREMLLAFTTSLKIGYLPPLGDNTDITAALTGRNRRKQVVIPPNHPSIDSQGRLLDRWGTPYWFHPRAADSFDLRSAGPDKKLFTPDDIAWSPRPLDSAPAGR